MSERIITVENLKKHFGVRRGGGFANTSGAIKAVDGVSFEINAGETVGLVGESGCGKSTTASMILKLTTPTSGKVSIDGIDIHNATDAEHSYYRKSVQAVFQDPYSSLSPRLRVRDIIAEPLRVNTTMTRQEINERVAEVVAQVGLSKDAPKLYPHEFSGGQRQRIALARALTLKPKLIVLDEPLSALDVSIKAQVMNLLKDLQRDSGIAYLLIAHNLADVRYMSNWVAVMYLGKIVESAPAEELFTAPLHPYTQALLSATLPAHPDAPRDEIALRGEIPSPIDVPSGCPFHTRCPKVMKMCSDVVPVLDPVASRHNVACHLYGGATEATGMPNIARA
jgi:peptide/nickel transport system ATP-binding protein/oligopeptide transport system ATP-binding protein